MRTLIVTRPSPDGEATCERLTEKLAGKGFTTLHAPLMTIDINAAAPPPQQPFDRLAFTSANGVRAYQAQRWFEAKPALCVGAATADAAAKAGLDVIATAGGNVRDLLDDIQAGSAGAILHVRGEYVTGALAADLTARGHAAQESVLYRARPTKTLSPSVVDAIGNGNTGLLFYSPRTVRIFGNLIMGFHPALDLSSTDAFCLSPAIGDVARGLPFRHVLDAPQTSEAALVDMIALLRT